MPCRAGECGVPPGAPPREEDVCERREDCREREVEGRWARGGCGPGLRGRGLKTDAGVLFTTGKVVDRSEVGVVAPSEFPPASRSWEIWVC